MFVIQINQMIFRKAQRLKQILILEITQCKRNKRKKHSLRVIQTENANQQEIKVSCTERKHVVVNTKFGKQSF